MAPANRVGGEAIYVLKPGSQAYEPLDAEFYERIVDGSAGY